MTTLQNPFDIEMFKLVLGNLLVSRHDHSIDYNVRFAMEYVDEINKQRLTATQEERVRATKDEEKQRQLKSLERQIRALEPYLREYDILKQQQSDLLWEK